MGTSLLIFRESVGFDGSRHLEVGEYVLLADLVG